MGRCALKTKDTLNRLFTKDGVTKTVSNMWEFLLLSPLNIMLSALIMIVVMGFRSVFKSFLKVDFLSLREPCACWFSPSMVELKENIV